MFVHFTSSTVPVCFVQLQGSQDRSSPAWFPAVLCAIVQSGGREAVMVYSVQCRVYSELSTFTVQRGALQHSTGKSGDQTTPWQQHLATLATPHSLQRSRERLQGDLQLINIYQETSSLISHRLDGFSYVTASYNKSWSRDNIEETERSLMLSQDDMTWWLVTVSSLSEKWHLSSPQIWSS